MMFPTMRHPSRHVWDFWYWFDAKTRLFHVFYLNADEVLVPTQRHHYAACVGYATTFDFIRMDWGDEQQFNVLSASRSHWANTSIWSGDTIAIRNGFLLFFTSREENQDDGMTQAIGMAYSKSLSSAPWQLSSLKLQPGGNYQPRTVLGDLTPHAWRDPFLFRAQNQVYMLLSAKSREEPIGRNGVVGQLRLKDNNFSAGEWEYLAPLSRPRCYSEMEVPQLFQDEQGAYELVFSTWANHDFATTTRQAGGLQGFTRPTLGDFNSKPHVLMPENHGLYACRIIPELAGEIVGFDIAEGGIRRSGVQTRFQAVDRDFSAFRFEEKFEEQES